MDWEKKTLTCFRCDKVGHSAYQCPNPYDLNYAAKKKLAQHLRSHPLTLQSWKDYSNKMTFKAGSYEKEMEAVLITHFLWCYEECLEEGHHHFASDCPTILRTNFRSDKHYECKRCGTHRHDTSECRWGGKTQNVDDDDVDPDIALKKMNVISAWEKRIDEEGVWWLNTVNGDKKEFDTQEENDEFELSLQQW